jgi:hypothetical protein
MNRRTPMKLAEHKAANRNLTVHFLFVGFIFLMAICGEATAQTAFKEKPFVVEYYYKAKWGYADEFIQLYKKNHFPVMKKEMEMGRILQISVAKPRYHATEDGRWDYKVTLVWKNIQVTDDGFDEASLIREMYPDQETYKKEEQRRFEILLGHWDVPIVDVELNK